MSWYENEVNIYEMIGFLDKNYVHSGVSLGINEHGEYVYWAGWGNYLPWYDDKGINE